MSVQEYRDTGLVKISDDLKLDSLAGKSVLITGGAGGLGKAYTQAFISAGAYVTVVDVNEDLGSSMVAELKKNAQFIKCDVTIWGDQVRAFEAAVQNSPHKSLDVVIGNAGIIGADDVFALQDPAGPPVEPDLRTIDVNLKGMLYTAKLAIHYFRRQPLDASRDRCLILKSSLAGYVDLPGSIQYNASKFGVRGIMASLRRTTWEQSIRVNLVAPWYVRTPIIPPPVQEYLVGQGIGFATTEDCCRAMLLIASDRTINGRAIGVCSRKHDSRGYMDLGLDDFKAGSLFSEWQQIVLDTARILAEFTA